MFTDHIEIVSHRLSAAIAHMLATPDADRLTPSVRQMLKSRMASLDEWGESCRAQSDREAAEKAVRECALLLHVRVDRIEAWALHILRGDGDAGADLMGDESSGDLWKARVGPIVEAFARFHGSYKLHELLSASLSAKDPARVASRLRAAMARAIGWHEATTFTSLHVYALDRNRYGLGGND